MGLDLAPRCNSCGKKIDVNNMRAIGNNKFVCRECHQGPKSSSFTSKKTPSAATGKTPITDSTHFFSMKEYHCTACGFQFKREPTKIVNRCPFCGKSSVKEKVDGPAQDFIR